MKKLLAKSFANNLEARSYGQTMVTPALAYPKTELISDVPVAVIEKTIKRRVSAVTGIVNPVRAPVLMVPTARTPVRAGAKVTTVPATGEKVLSGAVEL